MIKYGYKLFLCTLKIFDKFGQNLDFLKQLVMYQNLKFWVKKSISKKIAKNHYLVLKMALIRFWRSKVPICVEKWTFTRIQKMAIFDGYDP